MFEVNLGILSATGWICCMIMIYDNMRLTKENISFKKELRVERERNEVMFLKTIQKYKA